VVRKAFRLAVGLTQPPSHSLGNVGKGAFQGTEEPGREADCSSPI
jgi:hypothetical protein